MNCPAFLALLIVIPVAVSAQTITNITWATRFAAPPAQMDTRALAGVRLVVEKFGEENVVGFSSVGARVLGLNEAESRKLSRLLNLRYRKLRADALFKNCPSQLAYCYASTKPPMGRALVYRPTSLNTNLHPIVFLHGYGGSFKWYLHALARACPDRVIIAPAYGIQPSQIHQRYVRESLQETRRIIPTVEKMPRPILVGLSAGGRGACQLYAAASDDFAGMVCVAALPPRSTWNRFGRRHRMRFICGEIEPYVKDGSLAQALKFMRAKAVGVEVSLVEKGDHYFLLEFAGRSEMLLAEAVAAISGSQ